MASNAAMSKPRFLVDCPSPAHRAVAGALRLALTGNLAPGVEDDCAAADPMAFAEIAQSHYIDMALAPAFADKSPLREHFPDDLALFFTEMAAANARRNARLRAQLETIGAAFASKGIAAVALKGACELVEPWWPEPGGRYLSDLDLLVQQGDATRAAEVLLELGATSADDEGPKDHHHLPPFLAPDWATMVELHIEVGPPNMAAHLPADAVIANARASSLPGILIPTPEDRLLHLLLHAPKGGFGLMGGRLYLREIANIGAASARLGANVLQRAEDRIRSSDERSETYPYGAITEAILGSAARPQAREARATLRHFGRPQKMRWRDTLRWSVYYVKAALTDPKQRRKYVQNLLRPGKLKALREFHERSRRMMR